MSPRRPLGRDPLRVLVVNQTASTSGAELSLLTLLAAIKPEDATVTVASPEGQLADRVSELGLEHIAIRGTDASFRLSPRTTPPELLALARSSWQVARAAKATGADVIHANTTRAGLIAIGARRFGAPAPLVHVRDWAPPGRAADAVLGVVARRAGVIVANSRHVAEQFGRLADPPRGRRAPRVIHNPIDLARFDPARHDRHAARAALGLPLDAPLVGVVGQLTPWKGQDDAIRALAASGIDEAHLVVAGSAKFAGPAARFDNQAFAEGLPALATELGVADRVHFTGEIDDVPQLLAALDVLLVPSWEEAFGRVVVEGMAMGLPVIATSNGGPPEIIGDNRTGFLLPPREPDQWGSLLGVLLRDPDRRDRIGAAARDAARDYDPAHHAAAVLAVYRDLLG
ncbi:MAG: glycosyltransferase family 4 protein [Solirubrobacteraceae bacterium]|nr:glycosyltransferase family 4 protein [Solirubrobacteraceae bacterium]